MSWQRVDDGFHCHHKVDRLRNEYAPAVYRNALACWLLMLSRAGLSGPRFKRRTVYRMGEFDKRTGKPAVDALVTVGLWFEEDEWLSIANWNEYQKGGVGTELGRTSDEVGTDLGQSSDEVGTKLGRNRGPSHATSEPTSDPLPTQPSPAHPKLNKEADSPPSPPEPSPSEIIAELAARYPSPKLLAEARESCALTRRNGRMTDSVWARTMAKLGTFPVETVEAALRDFVERHADGDKGEQYLLGIVRGKAKRGSGPKGIARAATSEEFRGDDPAEFWGEVANG